MESPHEHPLIGYVMKRTSLPEDWPSSSLVTEIASVSECINSRPEGWIDFWLHNELGYYNSPADAPSIFPESDPSAHLLAFRLFPVEFIHDHSKPFPLPELSVIPLSKSFHSLGFDVVSRSYSAFFECSPLSCNRLCDEVPINQYCLVDTFEAARKLAVRCALEQPEPGSYFVVEVLRETL